MISYLITIIKVKEEAAVEKEDVEVIEDKKVTEIPSINKTEKEPIVVKENTEMMQIDFNMIGKESLLNEIADIEVMTMTPLDAMNTLFKIVQDAKKLK